MQKDIVLVASMAVLKPPQKNIPEKKPTVNRLINEYLTLGFFNFAHKVASFPAIVFSELHSNRIGDTQDEEAKASSSLSHINVTNQ